jgi:hypothetical protein
MEDRKDKDAASIVRRISFRIKGLKLENEGERTTE